MAKRRAKKTAGKGSAKSHGNPSKETIPRKPLAREVLKVIAEKELSQVAAGAVVRTAVSDFARVVGSPRRILP
jgi:hypothetical protein